jgi:alanine racemase
MDLILVNTEDDYYESGTEVEIFGETGNTVDTLAAQAETISYEVTCRITNRVPRKHIQKK